MNNFNSRGRYNNAPCKDCNDRKLNCHSTCPLYKQFKIEVELATQKRKEDFRLRKEAREWIN